MKTREIAEELNDQLTILLSGLYHEKVLSPSAVEDLRRAANHCAVVVERLLHWK